MNEGIIVLVGGLFVAVLILHAVGADKVLVDFVKSITKAIRGVVR